MTKQVGSVSLRAGYQLLYVKGVAQAGMSTFFRSPSSSTISSSLCVAQVLGAAVILIFFPEEEAERRHLPRGSGEQGTIVGRRAIDPRTSSRCARGHRLPTE